MRIKNFIPSDLFLEMEGLDIKEMRNLKQVVAIFGKNGAGKTRLLRALPNEIFQQLLPLRNLKSELHSLKQYEKLGGLTKEQKERYDSVIAEIEKIAINIDTVNDERVITIEPRGPMLSADEMNDSEYRQVAIQLLTNPKFEAIKENCLKLIKALYKAEMTRKYFEKYTDEKQYFANADKRQNKNAHVQRNLEELILRVLGKKLHHAPDEHMVPQIMLDNRPINLNELSSGEVQLLAYCAFIAVQSQDKIENQGDSLNGRTILLDEPDFYLHPKAQIDLLNGLRQIVGPKGQIWITSHSLALLSVLDRDEIWLMENGKIVSPSIETPNKALTSLIGEENIDSLENFLSSQYEWAAIQFALESLFPPKTVAHKEKDAQQEQVITRLTAPEKQLKILDFGAGQGRIAQEILRHPNVAEKIYYQALETDKSHYEQLDKLSSQLQKISKVNSSQERYVIDTYQKLDEAEFKEHFDYILLINVLHELPVSKWSSILNAIMNALKNDGKILLLEDQAIPRGEHAHEFGFIILNVEELKLLFSLTNKPKEFKHLDPKYNERLTCVEINKINSRIETQKVIEAFERKKTNCKTKINALREQKRKTPSDGRMNSFLTQLYANVDMALYELKGGKNN